MDKYDKRFFMKLYDYKFNQNCDYVWKKPDYMPRTKITDILEGSKSCLDILTDLKHGDCASLIQKNMLSRKKVISLIIQFIYILYVLHKNNYYHYDNNAGNICFKNIKRKYVRLPQLGLKIKSRGHQFSLIDYESSLHSSYELNGRDANIYAANLTYNMDLNIFIQKVLLKLDDKFINKIINNNKIIFGMNSSSSFDTVAKKLLNDYNDIYIGIKKDILECYKKVAEIEKLFIDFENNKNNKNKIITINRTFSIEAEISSYLAAYDKKLFCDILNIDFFDNLIDKQDFIFMKNNYDNLAEIIFYYAK